MCERVLSMYNGLAPRATRKIHTYTHSQVYIIYISLRLMGKTETVLYKCVCVCSGLLLGFRVVGV